MSLIRTRFSPSPTGYLHIGGVRTALFSWLYARHHGGQFILRVEDTDRERSTQASVDAILEGLSWVGLDYDDGPIFQSDRVDRYREVLDRFLEQGLAYHCYCTPEELDAVREEQRAQNIKPRYNRKCRDEIDPARPGVEPVIRFRNPLEGPVVFEDLVRGRISIRKEELDDLVIARGDGTPTYNFAVVVDDIDNPMTGLPTFLQRVQSRPLPTHVTPEARMMFQAIGRHLSPPARVGLAALLNPRFTSLTLKLLGAKGRTFAPLFRNTVNPTVVRGGEQINVVPGEVTLDLDGRLLPNFSPEQLVSELRAITGSDAVGIEVLSYDPGPKQPDMGLFDTLSNVLQESDPEGIPVPMLMPAATDDRLFARLGIHNYGFLPMLLPKTLDFAATIHGPDERVPVDAINFGAGAVYRLLQRYGRTS